VRIEENTFLVAGGGSGLGEAKAHMLAASGARVVVERDAQRRGHQARRGDPDGAELVSFAALGWGFPG
jgi:NAD(P)-dependent dehydrogenase (short-subunit alcohol dehydrogenase family)